MSEVLLFCDPGRVGYRAYVEGNAPALAGADVIDDDIDEITDNLFTDKEKAANFDLMARGIWDWMKIYKESREDMLCATLSGCSFMLKIITRFAELFATGDRYRFRRWCDSPTPCIGNSCCFL